MNELFKEYAASLSFFGLAAIVAAGCGGSASLTDRPCPCTDGYFCCSDTNTCLANGSVCSSEGGGSDAVVVDGGAIPDVGPSDSPLPYDAASCVSIASDFGDASALPACTGVPISDGGSGLDGSASCAPLSSVTLSNTWVPPTGGHQGKCNQDQMTKFRQYCLGTSADESACSNFVGDASNTACVSCISTPSNATAYGPLINEQATGTVAINVAGCVAVAEPCNEACAKAIAQSDTCRTSACTNCPSATDDASLAALNACETAADSCACEQNGSTFNALCTQFLVGSDHPAAGCIATAATFDNAYDFVVPLFCGP